MKVGLKDFIDIFDDTKDKEDRAYLLIDNADDIVKYFVRKPYKKQLDILKDYSELFNSKKFFKSFKKAAKYEPEYVISLCTMLSMYFESGKQLGNGYAPDDEMTADYLEIMEKLLKKQVNHLIKKTKLPADIIINVLVYLPCQEAIDEKHAWTAVSNCNRRIFKIAKDLKELDDEERLTPRNFTSLYKELFGDDLMEDVIVSNLLVKKETIKKFNPRQMKVFSMITEATLESLDDMKGKKILDILSRYIATRRNDENRNNDGPRRLKLQEIDGYSKITKAVNHIIEDNAEFARFL